MPSTKAELYLSYVLDPQTMGYTSVVVSTDLSGHSPLYSLCSDFGAISRKEMLALFTTHIRAQRPVDVFIVFPGREKPLALSRKTVVEIVEGKEDLYIGKE